MKRQLRYVLGTIIFATVAFALSAANAQTTSNGPYYANPSWDQKLQCDTQATCPRFIVLTNWNNAAVLDRETGLVWERSPRAPCLNFIFCNPITPGTFLWSDPSSTNTAAEHCNRLTVGNRTGWRLPTIQELASLIDPSVGPPGPSLPAGHPFSNVQSSRYWSATTIADAPVSAWLADLGLGDVNRDLKSVALFVWCVRGGQPGPDLQ